LQYLGTAILINHKRTRPTPVDNSEAHFYLVSERGQEAMASLKVPSLGGSGNVVAFREWKVDVMEKMLA
jgi:hypothetical protein